MQKCFFFILSEITLEIRDFLHGFQAWKRARFMHVLNKIFSQYAWIDFAAVHAMKICSKCLKDATRSEALEKR